MMGAATYSQPVCPQNNTLKTSSDIDPMSKAPVKPVKATTIEPPQAEKPATGMSWKEEYTRLSNEIQVRHYSPKTLKTYALWVRHFQTFTKSLDPKSLSTDIKHLQHPRRFWRSQPKLPHSLIPAAQDHVDDSIHVEISLHEITFLDCNAFQFRGFLCIESSTSFPVDLLPEVFPEN